MLNVFAMLVVLLLGIYLIALGVAAWWSPDRVRRFLGSFASSAAIHYAEMTLRLLAGWALLWSAPQMLFSRLFLVCGWVLVLTTISLAAVPWRLHHRFARWAVPIATRRLGLVAVASMLFGGGVVASVILGGVAH
jgi:hypothetical protein